MAPVYRSMAELQQRPALQAAQAAAAAVSAQVASESAAQLAAKEAARQAAAKVAARLAATLAPPPAQPANAPRGKHSGLEVENGEWLRKPLASGQTEEGVLHFVKDLRNVGVYAHQWL